GKPAAGLGVEMKLLGFLAPGTAALPGIHGALESRLPGVGTRLFKAPIAIAQQGTGENGNAQRQVGEDKQLVPENMAPIGFAVPAPGGNRSEDRRVGKETT